MHPLGKPTCRAALALAAGAWLGFAAQAQVQVPEQVPAQQAAQGPQPRLRLSPTLAPPPRGQAAARTPVVVQASELRTQPDRGLTAQGDVELRRAGTVLRADTLNYDQAQDRATARGRVRISRDGSVYSGPELQLTLGRFEGFFLQPDYEFASTGAGGHAARIDFIDSGRSVAHQATYTSCARDGSGTPDWLLSADKVTMNIPANEGIAQGAVLRFMGVPILALPTMSFPINNERKSGWLPPNVNLDSRSGLDVAVPYYWSIAPNRDATITPKIATRRGTGLMGEYRYLEPAYSGSVTLDTLPYDRAAGRSRWATLWTHDSSLLPRTRFGASVERVSDDDWWKDFPRAHAAVTPRLLPSRFQVQRDLGRGALDLDVYAQLHYWQVLQNLANPVIAPYQRSPQIGLRAAQRLDNGFEWTAQTEVNRFTLSDDAPVLGGAAPRPEGWRWHGLAALSRPWRDGGAWLVPRLQVNAASYATDLAMADGRRHATRWIPTLSVDTGMELERQTRWQGREFRQTLEPRLLYVYTPYRAQNGLPNFDAAGKDFNLSSIYSENSFSGVDRVSDAHQVTAGVSTRLLDATTGAEALRLSAVQRYLLREQRITPEGDTFARKWSDLLLLGSSNVLPHLALDVAMQYSPDLARPVRSIVGARYTPAPFQTFNASYRLARGLSEQIDLGWQWPVYRGNPASAKGCTGTLYAVGRLNYSLRDSRITDSVAGVEYDSGCWIARVVAERTSTGRSEATTRLLLQLELVGLSRLGSNPLKVLKDNIPGYRLLRDDRSDAAPAHLYE